ncbi:hypothetical protein LUZ62_019372 [Rhynchospora pubera]|uniref:DUF674 domain-containing protein n=1 Tax=Rhynchospora pubera TaxID=906938 RepID=A0AAV8GT95_9POAL|nr:hypothetical protein LUZ62_019372 [Rhynchospora pubera]
MASEKKLELKLLIEKKTQKVIFAEVGKDVVDLLFSLLSMPIGSVIKLLTKEAMVGCLSATYGSLEQLDDTYFLRTGIKSKLLNPDSSNLGPTNHWLLSAPSAPVLVGKTYYKCYKTDHSYVSSVYGSACPSCQGQMTSSLHSADKEDRGFVKGVMVYIIKDDLSVVPMSTESTISLLNKLGIRDLNCIEERTVSLGSQEQSIGNFKFIENALRSFQKSTE